MIRTVPNDPAVRALDVAFADSGVVRLVNLIDSVMGQRETGGRSACLPIIEEEFIR